MKRWLFKLMLFLLIGAVVNIVVAWSIALTSEVPLSTSEWELIGERDDGQQGSSIIEQYSRFGVLCVRSVHFPMYMSGARYQAFHKGKTSHVLRGSDLAEHTPSWLEAYETSCIDLSSDAILYDRSSISLGWPFLTVWGERKHYHLFAGGNAVYIPLRGKLNHPFSTGIYATDRVVGYLPIWHGIVANTIFYSVLVYSLFFSILQLRKFKRIRRGHCIKCGYDLRHVEHEVCPECGCELTAKAKP